MEQFTISPPEAGRRLDIVCVRRLPHYSRSALQKAIKAGQVTVNGKATKPRYVVEAGEVVVVPPLTPAEISPEVSAGVSIPILHEDREVVVINKPSGISVHSGVGVRQTTVADWFAQRYPHSRNVGEYDRPGPEVEIRSTSLRDVASSAKGSVSNFHFRAGIVHRLDKDTSGVMVLAKTQPAFESLKDQFKKHWVKKEYLALVFGVPGEKKGRITRPLARSQRNPLRRTVVGTGKPFDFAQGKPAITEWVLEEKLGKYALLRVFPFTGRTHQIRAHLHFLGFPIVGDPLYTFKRQTLPPGVSAQAGQMLHAEKLTVKLPSGKKKTFVAEVPTDFKNVLEALRNAK